MGVVFLVCFNDGNPQDNEKIVSFIKRKWSWARLAETVYCIKSDDETPSSIRNRLSDSNDNSRFFICDITNSGWASYSIPDEVALWLKNR